jgi:hypothetical protein
MWIVLHAQGYEHGPKMSKLGYVAGLIAQVSLPTRLSLLPVVVCCLLLLLLPVALVGVGREHHLENVINKKWEALVTCHNAQLGTTPG